MKLLVIGSSNMDLVIRLPRIPAPGETLMGSSSAINFGGKGANQAVGAKRAGADVGFITQLGDDLYGAQMRAHFLNEGFSEKYLLTSKDLPSGTAQIWVSASGENAIAVSPGANAALLPEQLTAFEQEILAADLILIQLEIPFETVKCVIELAQKGKTKVILNPAPARQLSDELFSKIWLLTPNEHELAILTGCQTSSIQEVGVAASQLLKKGVKEVLVTLGAKGSLLCNAEGQVHFEAPQVTAVDSTAAGDVFNGYLAALLSQNKPLREAIELATKAAALSVTKEGAQASIPYLSEVLAFGL